MRMEVGIESGKEVGEEMRWRWGKEVEKEVRM